MFLWGTLTLKYYSFAYLTFKFKWPFYILSGNPLQNEDNVAYFKGSGENYMS